MKAPRSRVPDVSVDDTVMADGCAVTLNGTTAKTPGNQPLVLPSAALAREIAGELELLLTDGPTSLACKGLGDPSQAANFRIATAAIDVITSTPDARAQIVADLVAYGETDLVCFRAEKPIGLVAAEKTAWAPLVDWFTAEFGAGLHVTTGLRTVPQEAATLDAVASAIEGHNDFALAALSLATRSAGSIVIGLALSHGRLDADGAYRASVVGEAYQAEHWGVDAGAAHTLESKALDLAQAARFFELLAKG